MCLLVGVAEQAVCRDREPAVPRRSRQRAAERLRRNSDEGQLVPDRLGSERKRDHERVEQLGASDHRTEARQVIARTPTAPRRRLWVLGILTLALCLAAGMTLGASADAKKKHKK